MVLQNVQCAPMGGENNRIRRGQTALWMLLASAIVLGIYVYCLYAYGIYPFGTQYTVASYDLSAQICPFIEHLFDVIDGKSSLFYSYAIAGGADVFGTFMYFFISPFSFLFLVFGDGMVAEAACVVMACKLAFLSAIGCWFVRKLFHNIPAILCVAIGIVYTYCGYMFTANTYINWVDFLMYMPMLIVAFKHFVHTGKFVAFSILMACCVYTCFSIACFAMFTVFPILIFYGLVCIEKGQKSTFIATLCLSFLVAILLSLPILLPALSAFLNSGRGGDLFENLWYGYDIQDGVKTFNQEKFLDSMGQSYNRKITYILSDSVFLVLTIIWMIRKGLKDKLVWFMIFAGFMTLLPVFVDESMLLLNMGSYMSYSLRFGFLNAAYFLGGACLCVEDVFAKRKLAATCVENQKDGGRVEMNDNSPAVEPAEKPYKKSFFKGTVWEVVFILFAVLAVAALGYFLLTDAYLTIWNHVTDSEEFLKNTKNFSGVFAHSLGGIYVIAVVFVIVAAVTIFGAILVKCKKIGLRLMTCVLVLTVGVQVLFYNDQLVRGNRSTQQITTGSYQRLSETLNEMDDGYFRIKDYGDKVTSNIPFKGNSNSFSVFSSVIDKDNFTIYHLFAYLGNGKNSLKSTHNTSKTNNSVAFGDSFLGYKYYFVPKANVKDVEKLDYMRPVMVETESGTTEPLQDGGFYIYENEIVFPMGYVLPQGDFTFVKPNEANSTYRKYNQRELYKFLRGKESKDTVISAKSTRELSEYLWGKAADVQVGAGKITARATAQADGECLFLSFVASSGYTVTVNGKPAELIENDLHFLSVALEEGENVVEFTYTSPYVERTGIGVVLAIIGLLVVAFIVQETKLVQTLSPLIAFAGIVLALALVGFFMVYPTTIFIEKVILLFA